jgi:hypothetical protein
MCLSDPVRLFVNLSISRIVDPWKVIHINPAQGLGPAIGLKISALPPLYGQADAINF